MGNREADRYNQELWELLCDKFKKDELLKACKAFGAKTRSSWNKTDLAMSLEYHLINHPRVLIDRLPLTDILFLQKMVHAGGEVVWSNPFYSIYLWHRGLIGVYPDRNNKLMIHYYIPQNLRDALAPVIDQLAEDETLIKWNKREKLMSGLCNLYGILSEDDFYKKYNAVSGETIGKTEFFFYQLRRDYILFNVIIFTIKGKYYFISPHVPDFEQLLIQIMEYKDLPYATFTEQEVLNAGETLHNPLTKERDALYKELIKRNLSEADAKGLILMTWECIQKEIPLGEIIELYKEFIIHEGLDKLTRFIQLLVDFQNSTARWILKGNAPNAVRKEAQKPLQPLPENPFDMNPYTAAGYSASFSSKVERNDPCPCGSGKKYKKCCGQEN